MKMLKQIMSLMLFLPLLHCASPQVTLKDAELIPAKDAADRTKIWSAKTINVASVDDQRQKPERWVGVAGTGMRNVPTPVELERSVAVTVKSQIEKELEERGLKLAAPADVTLKVHVRELEVKEVHNGALTPEASVCDGQFDVDVQSKTKTDAFKWTGKVSFQNRGTMLDTTKATAATLAGCLNMLVEKMVTNAEFKQTMTK